MKIKLPAGRYYIGDPCYCYDNDHPMENELWRKVCDGETNIDGVTVFYDYTAYGDGYYSDNKGNKYGVDAGIIGIVSGNICEKDYFEKSIEKRQDLGHFFEFDKEFEVVMGGGKFKFGNIKINTN